ncbi:MAG TPA: acyl-CoA dehydrogenase family protein [Terriglobia bacterium]|nr:acyl-CoA dehydrogenase family protein [Terriglobia bacterium]
MANTARDLVAVNETLSKEIFAPRADEIDRMRKFPRQNIEKLGQSGLLGLLVSREDGGAGGGIGEMAQVLETMAQSCASTAMVTLMHYCGAAVIAVTASAAVKKNLLPAIARGENLTTLAFSEAGSGGHFYMPVSEVHPNGDGMVLTAQKTFVTSAGEADSYVVSTRKSGASGPTEIDLYLVSKGAKGFELGKPFEGLGLAGNASAPMKLSDVRLPQDARLGTEGSGFETMMQVVLPHFLVGVAAVSVGIAAAAFAAAKAHVTSRKYEHASGNNLAVIPRVQFLVAEMAMELRAARAYLEATVRRVESRDPEMMLDLLAVKARAAEATLAVASRAMTLGGGSAYGRRGGLERNFRDAQAASVMAPATDVLKEFLGKACLGVPLF